MSLEAIEDDLEDFTDDIGEYLNGWYVTDSYDSDYPMFMSIPGSVTPVSGVLETDIPVYPV